MADDGAGGSKVKNLRAQFEQRAQQSQRNMVVTPEVFFKQQRDQAEKEAQAILLARKKAAAFNMAMRQIELQNASTIDKKPLTKEQEEKRNNLRKEARRLSIALRTIDDQAEAQRPVLQQKERRATNLLLASMAEELEHEMKKEDEALALINEGVEDQQQSRQAQEKERLEAEEQMRQRQELERAAHELAERARKEEQEAAAAEAARIATETEKATALAEKERQEREASNAKAKQESQKAEKEKQEKQDKDRAVLTSYLRENYPEKLGEVDDMLVKFAGNLDVLFEELGKNQKFKEVDIGPGDEADDEKTSEDEEGSEEEEEEDGGKRRSVGATTVHTYKDDETVAPSRRKSKGGNKDDKSFLSPGIDLRLVVSSFYSIYAPSKLKDIEDILRHFEAREADLFRTLEVKYDVTFARDGSCLPNNGDKVGDPFLSASSSSQSEPATKFAVDHQQRQLKDKLARQGQSPDRVQAVLSSGSGMM